MQRRIEDLRETYRDFQTKYRELQEQFTTLRQRFYLVQCAWCQGRIRWKRKASSVPDVISHGICRPCAARVLAQR